jgi:hypothetical protein
VFGSLPISAVLRVFPGQTTRQTGKTQQLERPISQQLVILFDSNFGDQQIKTLEISILIDTLQIA